jgi:hypothetical protein
MTETTTGTKVELIARTARTVTVRLPDGTTKTINGRDVVLVYCRKADLDEHLAKTPNRQTSIDCTLSPTGGLLIFGTANWI